MGISHLGKEFCIIIPKKRNCTEQPTLDPTIYGRTKHITAARAFVGQFGETETAHWQPFDGEKAVVASVASILRPGMTNTVTLRHDQWISQDTLPLLQDFAGFLTSLLELP